MENLKNIVKTLTEESLLKDETNQQNIKTERLDYKINVKKAKNDKHLNKIKSELKKLADKEEVLLKPLLDNITTKNQTFVISFSSLDKSDKKSQLSPFSELNNSLLDENWSIKKGTLKSMDERDFSFEKKFEKLKYSINEECNYILEDKETEKNLLYEFLVKMKKKSLKDKSKYFGTTVKDFMESYSFITGREISIEELIKILTNLIYK